MGNQQVSLFACNLIKKVRILPKKIKYEDVKESFQKENYILLEDEYISAGYKMKCQCPRGHIEYISWHKFKGGRRCYQCFNLYGRGKSQKLSYEEVKSVFEKEGYKLISKEYVNANTLLETICPQGHNYKTKLGNFKTGYRCPICSGVLVTYEQIKDYFLQQGYELLSTSYENSHAYLSYKCPKGHINSMSWSNFSRGKRCPSCSRSKGEEKIAKYLNDINVKYISQYKFDNCRNILPLPFDFYLPDYNLIIEYDGKQHFKPVDIFGGQDGFEETQLHDQIKTQYCKDNNIKLLRIPYYNFENIETILNEQIKNFND